MRIGYIGFVEADEVDVLVSPPASVRYEPQQRAEAVVTASGSLEMRGFTTQGNYAIRLEWQDIPENELAALAFVPPSEIVTLIDERLKEQKVVFNEPVRSMLSGTTDWAGRALYTASMTAFPVVSTQFEENREMGNPPTLRVTGGIRPPVVISRDPLPPPNAHPEEYSPVASNATTGLPPTVEVGEGVRFTFEVFADELGRYRYYSTDTDAYLEMRTGAQQEYKGWYSNLVPGEGVTAVSELRRWPFELDTEWSIGILYFRPAGAVNGELLRVLEDDGILAVSDVDDTITVTLNDNGLLQTFQAESAEDEYHYLWLTRSGGLLYVSLDGEEPVQAVSASAPAVQTSQTGVYVGGSGTFIDDLLFVSRDDVDRAAVTDWLLGDFFDG